MIYIPILIYTLFLVYRYDYRRIQNSFNLHFYCLLAISILLGGLSYRLGIDTLRYEAFFESLHEGSFYDIKDYLTSSYEPIWFFLNRFISSIGAPFWVFRIVVLGFVNSIYFWFIKKYSPAVFFAIFVYFIYFYFDFNFQITREALAVAFTLIGLDRFLSSKRERGFLLYLFWLFIASLCHHYAIIGIIVPFATLLTNGKRFAIAIIIVLILVPYMDWFFTTIGMADEDLTVKIEGYLSIDRQGYQNGVSLIIILKNLIMGGLPVFLCLSCFKWSKYGRFSGFAFVYIVIGILSVSSLGIIYRLESYFAIPMAVSMGESFYYTVVEKERGKLSKNNLITTIIFVWLFFAPLYTLFKSYLWPMYIPYSSVITKNTNAVRENLYRFAGE